MLMFSGMFLADAGTSATLMTACLPSLVISRTCPTRAPWRRTSPNLASCRPASSALIVTIVGLVKAFVVDRDRQPDEQCDDGDEGDARPEEPRVLALGVVGDVDEHRRYPVIRTVVVEPQMAKLRKKSATTIVTIEVRIAWPTAVPTPAGPPEAV